MKHKIRLIFSLICFSIFFSCAKKHVPSVNFSKGTPFVLSGKIVNKDSGKVYLCHMDETEQTAFRQVDSTFIVNGKFMFSGRLKGPDLFKLQINPGEFGWPYSSWFVLDTGYAYAQLFKDSMPNSKIIGGKQQERLSAYNRKMFQVDDYYSRLPVNTMPADSQDLWDKNFMNARGKVILETVSDDPTSILSSFIALKSLTGQVPLYWVESIYDKLDSRNNFYARSFHKALVKKQKLAARTFSVNGARAPKFVLKDPNGNIISKKNFKGKYLLLDFWASWCKPCMDELPALVSIYNKYHSKGFNVVSISLDSYKEELDDALQALHLPWPQTCDFKGSEGEVFKKYKVEFIPYNFLIDPSGRIVDQNIRPERLNEMLAKIYY